ncbi:MAG: isoaspartyl peptidase/L-asparaginase family protein [Candidatus Andeanibacterium colombiense]|uniref:Isoaspartyl peptidase n=1 Tax=Candidatus Andeanibacterium colombiense TaxID=3121345 RepID=A0AAJ5X694_9SPHN|nr:MAG: isoaspartyl peptidase/L-asparaginase family protein [Sphingomonadaceae bacterium]
MQPHSESWSVVVHGGARTIPDPERAGCVEACLKAVRAAAAILSAGGSALDAVEAATRMLEDAPNFNAGLSSVRNAAGDIEMDAAIMDGETLALGGVGALRDVRHPVSVARGLLPERPVLLVGDGAAKFAASIGAEPAPLIPLVTPAVAGGDTVGCVARDTHGHVAAAGSTGGIAGKMVGRVGDTPLPGCGLYADDELGAVAVSGDGESIARTLLATHALWSARDSTPTTAAQAAIERMKRVGGEAGAILIDRLGRIGIAHNSRNFSVGVASSQLERPHAATRADDLKEWLE